MSVARSADMEIIELVPAVCAALTVVLVISFIVYCAREIDAEEARVARR